MTPPRLGPRQLGLPFPHQPDFAAADFLAAPANQAGRVWLGDPQVWPSGRLALFGDPDVGKSHLLHCWARREGALLVHGPALHGLPALPENVGARGGVAVDDADLMAEEISLLHLLNACAEAGLRVVLAGRAPPARWPVMLPDLASRLRAITAVEIEPPDDALLQALLAKLLAERQLSVAAPLQAYLLTRLPRTAASLAEAARRLDRLALATGGRVTRTLVAHVLAGLNAEVQPEDDIFTSDGPALL